MIYQESYMISGTIITTSCIVDMWSFTIGNHMWNFKSKRRYVRLSYKYDVWALDYAFLIYEVNIKCTWLHQSPVMYLLSVIAAKSISSSFFKFLYCLEGEQLQLHLPFIYLIFQIYFATNLLSFFYLIKILFLHYFFILSIIFLYLSSIHFQRLYFSNF